MNTMPARSSARCIVVDRRSDRTPSASSTSALPHCDVNERLPCLATRTPAPAASSAAAVEMLKVVTAPPPVPQVSTSSVGIVGRQPHHRVAQRAHPAGHLVGAFALDAERHEQRRDLRRRRLRRA